MTEPTPLKEHQTQLHADLIEALRDTWPAQKGLDALLFQNDLFYRLKNLEDIAEGGGGPGSVYPSGFLHGGWPSFKGGRDQYLKVWNSIDAACIPGDWTFVDATEDLVVAWCEDMIPERIAFFSAALETGSLDVEWMEKAELLREAHGPEEKPLESAAESTNAESTNAESTNAESTNAETTIVIPAEPVIALRPPSHPTRRRHDRPFTPTRAKPRVRNTRRRK